MEWAKKHFAKKRKKVNRRQEQAKNRGRSGGGSESKGTFQNQEFRRKAAKARQAERCENRYSHKPGELRIYFAKSAEILECAQPASAPFEKIDKSKKSGGKQSVADHLENYTVYGGGAVISQSCGSGARGGNQAEHAITQMT